MIFAGDVSIEAPVVLLEVAALGAAGAVFGYIGRGGESAAETGVGGVDIRLVLAVQR